MSDRNNNTTDQLAGLSDRELELKLQRSLGTVARTLDSDRYRAALQQAKDLRAEQHSRKTP